MKKIKNFFLGILHLINKILIKVFVLFVKGYQVLISPFFPASCRFYPTCSSYSIQALKKHGVLKGTFLSVNRIIRCNPFNPGGVDPVPEEFTFFKKNK